MYCSRLLPTGGSNGTFGHKDRGATGADAPLLSITLYMHPTLLMFCSPRSPDLILKMRARQCFHINPLTLDPSRSSWHGATVSNEVACSSPVASDSASLIFTVLRDEGVVAPRSGNSCTQHHRCWNVRSWCKTCNWRKVSSLHTTRRQNTRCALAHVKSPTSLIKPKRNRRNNHPISRKTCSNFTPSCH